MTAFHDIRFPLDISLRSRGGPERRTDIVTLASGHEERNSRWMHARRRYDAGYGIRSIADLATVVSFFEERRGRLHGFRYRDRLDWRSSAAGSDPHHSDQLIGLGDGMRAGFPLVKTYGSGPSAYVRPITKPVAGSVSVAVDGIAQIEGVDFDLDASSGELVFRAGKIPAQSAVITAGYAFDVPVRFDTDHLEVNLASFDAGDIPSIPLIEILT